MVKDRKAGSKTKITDKSLLKKFFLHHLFLQAARLPFRFEKGVPASIFIFKVKPPHDKKLQWDFQDGLQWMTIACRIGEVGILTSLQDGGAQRDSKGAFWKRFQKYELHPLHFTELTAAFFYSTSLLNRVPKFMLYERPDHVRVVPIPLQETSSKPIFDVEWNAEAFARLLSSMTALPFDMVFTPPNIIKTWVHDAQGNVNPRPVSDGLEMGRIG